MVEANGKDPKHAVQLSQCKVVVLTNITAVNLKLALKISRSVMMNLQKMMTKATCW